jgi:hypothetical protein
LRERSESGSKLPHSKALRRSSNARLPLIARETYVHGQQEADLTRRIATRTPQLCDSTVP